ncbi:hypothetical protein GQ600_18645 [Phytophthora cactorum]|nr:hypothetical protein GQ600_18645 [Phytophthora cactorum]
MKACRSRGYVSLLDWALHRHSKATEASSGSDGDIAVSVGQVEPASRREATEDWRTVNDAPESKYSQLFTDAELDAIKACDPGDEGTIPARSGEVTGLDEATLERVVCENVVLPLQEEDVVATVSEGLPRPAPFGRKAIQKEKVRGVRQ